MAPKTKPAELTFEFEWDPNYRLMPCTGIWGGIAPGGHVKIDFFVDGWPVPGSITHSIVDGRLGPETSRNPAINSGKVQRTVVGGLLLDKATAKLILRFLEAKISELDTIEGKSQEVKE